MPFTKKIVAFDLDGTLAESKLPLKSNMAEALAKLSHITRIAIIGGGSYQKFKDQLLVPLEEYETSLNDSDQNSDRPHINYSHIMLLPTTGSQRFEYDVDKKEWTQTDKKEFPDFLKVKVLAALDDMRDNPDCRKEFQIPESEERFGDPVEERGTQITFSALGQDAPIEKKALWDADRIKRQKIKLHLEKLLPEVDVNIAGLTSIDILPKGFNKAEGLRLLLQKLNLTINDIEFVGDSVFPGGNDYSPLEANIKTDAIKTPDDTLALVNSWL